MKHTLRSSLFTAILVSVIFPSYGRLLLPSLVSSNMILQRNSDIRIWGWASAGSLISIKAGWTVNEATANTDSDGKWSVILPTPDAGGPYDMVIAGDGSTRILSGIMLGEVWLCSGQSNMEFNFRGLGGWNTYPDVQKELASGHADNLRIFTVQRDTSGIQLNDCHGNWIKPDTANALDISATAWYYGMEISSRLGIPVGLIVSAWGGTPAEAWTPANVIEENPALTFYRNNPNCTPWFPGKYSVLFNAMIHPLLNYRMRGVIWYQGESNVGDADKYTGLFTAMITGWRKAWGIGDFPFYFVQIAPYTYNHPLEGALLREAQLKSLMLSNTGMAVTMDIAGDVTDIHPKNKKDVSKRLALWALAKTYNLDAGVVSGPLYKSMQKEGRKIRLFFDYAGEGLEIRNVGNTHDFLISGADRYFIPAKVKVDGKSLVVWSKMVKDPVAVRYAFSNEATGSLYNSAGLPASSFRTDTLPPVNIEVGIVPVAVPHLRTAGYRLTSPPGTEIRYTANKTEPITDSHLYANDTLFFEGDYLLAARAFLQGIPSESVSSWRISAHKALGTNITYKYPFSGKYPAGGVIGLVDGLTGTLRFGDGRWQGFEGDDMDVTMDLGEAKQIRSITLSFLSDPKDWIFEPKHIEIRVSADGQNFRTLQRFDNYLMLAGVKPSEISERIEVKAKCLETARYIRIYANNIGVCPNGHPGEGQKAWLFSDEIIVN